MKQAVAHLVPYIEEERLARVAADGGRAGRRRRTAGRVVMATVKGDVHDIGKNIVGVVLGCNDYEVIDLGRDGARSRGSSRRLGSSTPTSSACRASSPRRSRRWYGSRRRWSARASGCRCSSAAPPPRAPTRRSKIEPAYSGPVVHVMDASRAVGVAGALLDPAARDDVRRRTRGEYAARPPGARGARPREQRLTLAEARANRRLRIDWSVAPPPRPRFLGVHGRRRLRARRSSSSASTGPRSSATWELTGPYPAILDDARLGAAAAVPVRGRPGDCCSASWTSGCSGRAASSASGRPASTPERRHRGLRGRGAVASGAPSSIRCASRWRRAGAGRTSRCRTSWHPLDSGVDDYVGAFAVTAGLGAGGAAPGGSKARHDDYDAILLKALADRLAEAFAELLHERVRRELLGLRAGRGSSATTTSSPSATRASGRRRATPPAPTTRRRRRCSSCSTPRSGSASR